MIPISSNSSSSSVSAPYRSIPSLALGGSSISSPVGLVVGASVTASPPSVGWTVGWTVGSSVSTSS